MPLDADYIVDRHRLKRRLTVWRLIAILALVGAALLAFSENAPIGGKGPHIARLDVTGVIYDDFRRIEALNDAIDDPSVRALIVYIDSPGGTVVGGENLYKTIRQFGKKKPVVAVMGGLATSAGYMTAIAGERIFAHEGTVTGSIGVLFQTAEVTALLEKLGVSVDSIKSGPLKAAPSPFEKTSPEARAATRALVDDMYRMFVTMVADSRKIPMPKLRELADGRVYTGRMAVQNGLIDAIGGEMQARVWLESEKKISKDLAVRPLKVERNVEHWLGELTTLAGKKVLSERLTLDGLLSVWHPQLQ